MVTMSKLYRLSDHPVFAPETTQSLGDYEGQVLLVYNAAAL